MTDRLGLQSFAEFLPPDAVELIRTRVAAEFATVSVAGVPIDTPTYFFPNADLTTLDIGTGVAYPAKAERARRNPKVGMLIEGNPDQPVIAVAGRAAVYDADIQANVDRYLAETIFAPNVDPAIVPWEHTRQRLYYLARIIVAVAPCHVRWWPNRAAVVGPPREWRARAGTEFPRSDPKPAGDPAAAPQWNKHAWRDLAAQALASGMPGHLTLLDDGGYPIPIRVGEIRADGGGFRMHVPAGAPWSEGNATLSFVGKEVFIGHARREGPDTALRVEYALPVLPMVESRDEPKPDAIKALNDRLVFEMARRGQPLPKVPEAPPAPTEGAKLRAAASRAMDAKQVGSGLPR